MSAILSADDLNDFISPGVACIKPVETLPALPPSSPADNAHEVILDGQHAAAAVGPAHITLTDCLACSGCVTSAEAVLVSLQSHAEVAGVLDGAPALEVRLGGADGRTALVDGVDDDAERRLLVVSVAPQVRASLAAACGGGTTAAQAGHMLERLFAGPEGLRAGGRWRNGFAWVLDICAAREAALVLGRDEVLQRQSAGTAHGGREVLGSGNGGGTKQQQRAQTSGPILTASCPGWVCYAEKTHPHVLPRLSRVKSPQALCGTLAKSVLAARLGVPPARVWHLAVMPCLDKKLEASREELTDASWAAGGMPESSSPVRDVDCVITTKEVLMLAESRNIDFFSLPKTPLPSRDRLPFPDPVIDRLLFPQHHQPPHNHRGVRHRPTPEEGTSGGMLHFLLRSLCTDGRTVRTVRGRNADVVEYAVVEPDGATVVFKAARFYGFRNIQNLVRKLKPTRPSRLAGGGGGGGVGGAARRAAGAASKAAAGAGGLDYAYVEVMACPGGCTNGGGQIKVEDEVVVSRKKFAAKPGLVEQKHWLAEVDEAYFSAGDSEGEDGPDHPMTDAPGPGTGGEVVDGIDVSFIRDTLEHWSRITGIDLDRLAHTTYREVISDVGKDISDVDRVVQISSKVDGGW